MALDDQVHSSQPGALWSVKSIIIIIIIHPTEKGVRSKGYIPNQEVVTTCTSSEDWKPGTKSELSLNSLTKLTESKEILL